MDAIDIRWQQRLANYNKAYSQLRKAVDSSCERQLSDLEKQGLIQSFEFTWELAWNVMRDYLIYQGITPVRGAREAIREAYNKGLIDEGEEWMETVESRNLSSHTYNEETAEAIIGQIINSYHCLFEKFKDKMNDIASQERRK